LGLKVLQYWKGVNILTQNQLETKKSVDSIVFII